MIKPLTKKLSKSIKGPVYALAFTQEGMSSEYIYDCTMKKALKWNKRNNFSALFVSNGTQDYFLPGRTITKDQEILAIVFHDLIAKEGNLAKMMCRLAQKTEEASFFEFASFLDTNNLLHTIK